MPVSRGYPKGSGSYVAPVTDGLSGGVAESSSATAIDLSSVVSGLAGIADALAETSKDIITTLALSAGQALVVLAADYKAYFDLTAYSGSILEVAADSNAILKIYGDLHLDNDAAFNMNNEGTLNRKGN